MILKLVVGLTILNVWFFRATRKTPYRGGDAKSLKEEFKVYGLSDTVYQTVLVVKSLLAVLLLVSVFVPDLTNFASGGIILMMIGAAYMHFKVKDSFQKTMPALVMLILSVAIRMMG